MEHETSERRQVKPSKGRRKSLIVASEAQETRGPGK